MSGPVVIVGAGQAGYALAATLRKAAPERPVTLVGDEPHAPYERPPLSKALMQPEAPLEPPYFLPPAAWAERGVALLMGRRALRIDPAARLLHLDDGSALPWQDLVLATGGEARRLAVPGAELLLPLRRLGDVAPIRAAMAPGRRLALVGGGVIGLELAATARALGAEAMVIEAAPCIMARALPPAERDWLEGLHRAQGTRFVLGAALAAVEPAGQGVALVLADGRRLPADVAVAGVGLARNTALAAQAGIALRTGILTDAFGRTSAPGIWAAGDVAEPAFPGMAEPLPAESYHAALDQGQALARTLAGTPTAYPRVLRWWTEQFGLNIQAAGDWRAAAGFETEGDRAGGSFAVTGRNAAGRPVFAMAVNAPRRLRPLVTEITATFAATEHQTA